MANKMSQEEYENKLRNVHRFIPFLENMITQLKDPKKKNREQQVSKMESLYQMITDKNKKLKLETLQKCEEVIIKLYFKVKGENAPLPPLQPTDQSNRMEVKRKPINLYSIASETVNKQKSYNDLYGATGGASGSKSPRHANFSLRKPPISYSDLECLQQDVVHELEKKMTSNEIEKKISNNVLEKKMSLNELNSLKNRLCKELAETETTDQINTTVRNKPVLMRMNAASPDKNKKKLETTTKTETKKEAGISKKKDTKPAAPKVLKEADLFCNAFSEIDKTYENAVKKKDEKKNSQEKNEPVEDAAEKLSLKQLADKAALLRKVAENKETSADTTDGSKKTTPEADVEKVNPAKTNEINTCDIITTESITKTDDSVENNEEKTKLDVDMTKTDDIEGMKAVDAVPSDKPQDSKEKKHSSSRDKKQGDCKKDKSEKSHKSDHKKDKNDRSHKSDHKKDKDDKRKDKNQDKSKKESKDKEKRDGSKDKGSKSPSNKSSKEKLKKDLGKQEQVKEQTKDEKSKTTEGSAVVLDVLNKIHSQIDEIKGKSIDVDLDVVSKTLDAVTKTKPNIQLSPQPVPAPVVQFKPQPVPAPLFQQKPQPVPPPVVSVKPQPPQEEPKGINRDPRLKLGKNQPQNPAAVERLAFKYNPKPKRQEPEADLDKNVLDSIEKSMKESNIPLLPPLIAPPVSSIDLFSPESPDEMDKAAVPPLINDLLLNPKTTGMINEVVSALRRSNNEKNLINIATTSNVTAEVVLKQPQCLNFSPPVPKLQFDPPPIDRPFVPQPIISNQARSFNNFPEQTDIERTNYPMPRNQLLFEPPATAHLNPCEDRLGQGYFLDRPGNYIPESPSYGAPSNYIPPSPSYVPPSPLYEGADTFRERNVGYQNYQAPNQRRYSEDRAGRTPLPGDRPGFLGDARPGFMGEPRVGLLGDAPAGLPYKVPFNQNNYDRFGQRIGCNAIGPRSNYYGATSRDPRVNMNRGAQFPGHEPRPMAKESHMTYREYKEQKERENRERERREKEIREREALEKERRERDVLEKERREKEEAELKAKAPEQRDEGENKQKDAEKEKASDKLDERQADRSRDRNRARDRSRDRYSRNRSSSRYRRDRDDYRSRGDRRGRDDRDDRRDRSRNVDSKFDKAYAARGKDRDSLPLNNLFAPKTNGKGSQYKIPKKAKEEEPAKEEVKTDTTSQVEAAQTSDNDPKKEDDSIPKTGDVEKPKKEKKTKEKDDDVVEKKTEIPEVKVDKSPEKKPKETKDQSEDKVVEEDKTEENEPEESNKEDKAKSDTDQSENKTSKTSDKKEEEENILSKFFQNLMKSSNKVEKKGALLSLISTFSDSFSDQQLEKITNIIQSDDVDDEPKKEEKKEKKEELSTCKDEIESNAESENTPEESPEKIEEAIETPEAEEVPDDKTVVADVASRMKTRASYEAPKEVKSKAKLKTELDRLHDDIREMFIRDGVVTATGKRMCRMLKDTPSSSSPSTESEKLEEDHSFEETEKKLPGPRRRGRKPGYRKNLETPELEMRELTVVLPKMSLEEIRKGEDTSERESPEKETHQDEEEDTREHVSDEDVSDKEPVEKTCAVKRGRQKKRNSWATGVIKKKPGPKSRKQKLDSPEVDVKKPVKEVETESKPEGPIENLHDIDYCMKAGQKRMQCKYCDVATKWIAAHYRTEHPDKEVLSSRLPPKIAKAVIADAVKNQQVYEADYEESKTRHDFTCCFCDYKQLTLPRMYRDHVAIHTGEFRHTCPYCSFSRSHIKTMQSHVNEVHAAEEAVSRKPIVSERALNNRNIYAYLCEACNFTQMNFENVEKHVETYHPEIKDSNIYKIKVNQTVKFEEDDAKPQFERKTRRSIKSSKVEAVKSDCEDAKEESSPDLKKEERVEAKEEATKIPEDLEASNTEIEDDSLEQEKTPKKRVRRKRDKSVGAPSPARKRLKRRCTLKASPSKEVEEEPVEKAKNVEEAVFTSNTDIQEENKRIEEERLKTMQDINSSIKLRTSLDFVEKLSHRLKQEGEVVVKQEVEEPVEEVVEKIQVSDLPVFEKSAIQNRETEPVRQENAAKACKESGRVNPVSDVIEKLQGMLGNPATCDDVSDESSQPPTEDVPPALEEVAKVVPPKGNETNQPPPLIHMDKVDQAIEKSNMVNSETLNIGYVKIMKTTSTYIYICCLPPCIYSSRDRALFTNHCKYHHVWTDASPKSTSCAECGQLIKAPEDSNLLVTALNHAVTAHSDFLGVKIGSIRISSNLFPDCKNEDEESLEEEPHTPPTISIPSPEGVDAEEVGGLLEAEPRVENEEQDNPFSFKIVDVVSLADDDSEALIPPEQEVEDDRSAEIEHDPLNIENSPTIQAKNRLEISHLLVKHWKKQPPKKSPMAMKKFLVNHFDLYKCPDYSCLFTTNKRKMFDIHLRMHPNHKKVMNCLYCDKMILFESTGQHYEKWHAICRFSCAYCLYRCIAKDYMDIHQLITHPEKPSRMQLLPKRDAEEKNTISILNEVKKSSLITPYKCCNLEFIHQVPYREHVDKCPNNTHFMCSFVNSKDFMCRRVHTSSKLLVQHWGTAHGVYPLECAYCNVGDFDLSAMMIHLVLEHPTLPPEVMDRYNEPVNKTKKTTASVKCNFKLLLNDLKANFKRICPLKEKAGTVAIAPAPAPLAVAALNPLAVNSPAPPTMQKAFEHFVTTNSRQPPKMVALSKMTPINVMKTSSPPSLTLLKPTTKANLINAGGLLYCISPAPSNPSSILKAIVVNKDKTVVSPKKLQLIKPAPAPTDAAFQIVVPVKPNLPKLAPLTSVGGAAATQIGGAAVDAVTSSEPVGGQEGESVETNGVPGEAQKEGDEGDEGMDMELENLEEPMVIIGGELGNKDRPEDVDPLSLEPDDLPLSQTPKSPNPCATPVHEYDSDRDADQPEMTMQKTGLDGYQLYRCAKCEMFFPGSGQFKEHLIKFTQCRFEKYPQRPYKCYHCKKYLKHYTNLLDHLGYHGLPKFTCSLCDKKFPHANQVKYHMKTKHNIVNVQIHSINDCFIAKPQVVGSVKQAVKEPNNESDKQKPEELKTVYYSFEADQIPQKSILGYDITCGHCKKFKNKVRSNIVRHLLLHTNDKDFTVPDTAPVNPVPCLEKNEKMFDKMYNLASSSHTGGRMGGQQKGEVNKDKAKDTNHPAFVPVNKRFQCCAVGCNYLCLEEGNLRHHLTALHMEDLSFVCVHCKRDLSDAADVDTIIKHLKLHELHLYKCSSCDYMHNLRHKIERHIGEEHKNKESTVVVIRAMDSEPFDDNHQQQQQSTMPTTVVNQKAPKSWRCCMCKYRCHTEEEVVTHVTNKHNIDCRYKCSLCTFKANEISEFKEHLSGDHPDDEVDVISVYKKDDENTVPVPESEQFDTTPLWSRDKPRVRHIRGILFEEDTSAKKKSTPVKTTQMEQNAKESTLNSASTKKRKRSIGAFNEPQRSEDELVEPKKEAFEPMVLNVQKSGDVIVIEDDEDKDDSREDADKVEETTETQVYELDLICMFGDFGMPLNKHFKCPKCEKYKTTKMRDFVQHMAGELRYHRFLCDICQEKFITLENIQMHCIDYHDCSVKSVVHMPIDERMNKWLSLLLNEQRKIIKSLGFSCEEIPEQVEDFLGSLEVSSSSSRSVKCKECGFSVSGAQALDRHMKYNHPHVAFARNPAAAVAAPADPPRPRATSVSEKKRKMEEPTEGRSDAKKLKATKGGNYFAKDKYVCRQCSMEFNSVPEMEYHGKEVHGGTVDYAVKTTDFSITPGIIRNIQRCRYCTKTGNKTNLEQHIATDHPGQKLDTYRFSCGVCSAKFEVLKSFKQHFKSHDLPEVYYYDIHDRRIVLNATTSTPKQKMYKCPVCSYRGKSVNSANIKHHLKLHAKPFRCDLCQSMFKTRPDARSHHQKEHPHSSESITILEEMVEKINKLMEEVMKNVTEVQEGVKTEEEEPTNVGMEPEVVLKTAEDEAVDVEEMGAGRLGESSTTNSERKRFFARKSTGLNVKPDESQEYYSFYGQRPEAVDMKKIITNFEIADAQMKMSCDQLGRIYNLNPTVRVKDCITLIIDDEDEVSS